jgi:protein-tyrosine phosphatase
VPPYRICFVCMGNICRSPTAAVVMRSVLADAGLAERVVVDSAGTGGWHAGGPADERAVEVMRAHGYNAGEHIARQFDAAWFTERDLIVAMDEDNLRALQRLAPPGAGSTLFLLRSFDPQSTPGDLDVPDPYYSGPGGFDHVLALVEAACDGLLDYVRTQL